MQNSIFIYGTLLIPEIRNALLGRRLKSVKAFLPNYSRFSIIKEGQESEYPVLKVSDGNSLEGLVVFPLSNADLKILSYYEGDEYFLKEVSVNQKGKLIKTTTYYPVNADKLKYGSEWSIDVFKVQYLNTYLTEVIPLMITEYKLSFE